MNSPNDSSDTPDAASLTTAPISEVEAEYRRRMFALPVHEKIARMARSYGLAKAAIGRRLTDEHGPMSARRLQLMIGREMYRRDPDVCGWIDRELARVPD